MSISTSFANQLTNRLPSFDSAPNSRAPSSSSATKLNFDGSDISPKSALASALRHGSESQLSTQLKSTKAADPKAYDDAIRDFVTPALESKTKLEAHLAIFDTDGDKSLSMYEMYVGPRSVNLGVGTSAGLAVGGGIVMGLKTATWYNPATWFAVNIDTDTIQRARHENSDSGLFADNVPPAQRKELVDAIWKHSSDGKLTLKQLDSYLTDIAGPDANWLDKFQSKGEFGAIFEATQSESVSRQQLEDFFNNVMFYQLMPADKVAPRLMELRDSQPKKAQALPRM